MKLHVTARTIPSDTELWNIEVKITLYRYSVLSLVYTSDFGVKSGKGHSGPEFSIDSRLNLRFWCKKQESSLMTGIEY